MTTKKSIPGTVEANGRLYFEGKGGNLQPVENYSAKDQLIHEQVYTMVDYAKGLSAELSRFKSHSYADVAAMQALIDQQYGAKEGETKGNRTYTSIDGRRQVKIKIATPMQITADLQSAKKLIDEIILEKGADAHPVLVGLVNQVFSVGKEGKVDIDILLALRRLELDDPRWPRVRAAIDNAIQPGESKSYITFHERTGAEGKMEMILLDLAAISPTPAAFEYPSLRRQVEELQAQLDELLAEPEDSNDDVLPPRLVDDLYAADELLGMVLPHLEAAAQREGANIDRIADVVCELRANHSLIQSMFADAKAVTPLAAE